MLPTVFEATFMPICQEKGRKRLKKNYNTCQETKQSISPLKYRRLQRLKKR